MPSSDSPPWGTSRRTSWLRNCWYPTAVPLRACWAVASLCGSPAAPQQIRERSKGTVPASRILSAAHFPLLRTFACSLYLSRATNILKHSHLWHHLFDLLPSGRYYRSTKSGANSLKHSFYPRAICALWSCSILNVQDFNYCNLQHQMECGVRNLTHTVLWITTYIFKVNTVLLCGIWCLLYALLLILNTSFNTLSDFCSSFLPTFFLWPSRIIIQFRCTCATTVKASIRPFILQSNSMHFLLLPHTSLSLTGWLNSWKAAVTFIPDNHRSLWLANTSSALKHISVVLSGSLKVSE